MASHAVSLDQLLASGRVRYGGSVQPRGRGSLRTPSNWGYAEVAGRFVELCAGGSSANLTVAAGLVQDAQRQREPSAWICPAGSSFHAPDLADSGVDLDALAVVRAPDMPVALRAADELLRSGAFGMLVLDGVESRSLSMAAQVRLANLAQQHDAAFLCLCREPVVGSLASLRLQTFFRRASSPPGEDGHPLFEYGFEAVKDRRRGRRWTWTETCVGPPGM
ncbi:MAG: recombinase A [Planctomycetota bacterium]|nr:recombinase A [Planctomycetota bacterium]MDA0934362.1 recombinase A [Planctomycetota bacterium]